MVLVLYNLLFPLAFLLYLPLFLRKLIRRGGVDWRFFERFGVYGPEQKQRLRALKHPVWIHAVSVGEVVVANSFLRAWHERRPDLDFVVSTTTATGHAVALDKLPNGVPVVYSPLDFCVPVWRALHGIRPRMLVLCEVEIWPNLIRLTRRRGVPVVLANGRMSDRSALGYQRHSWLFRPLFRSLSALCVQTVEDGTRLHAVAGMDAPVTVCSTMKFDQVPDAESGGREEILDAALGPAPRLLLVMGSTHPGEEELACRAFRELAADFPALRMVLAPRHVERTAEIRALLDREGLRYRVLTEVRDGDGTAAHGPGDVLLVDTTGELMHFYALADIAYVGKTLAGNRGGHNIIEPAVFGRPVLHGPNMQNFRGVAAAFRARQATREVPTDDDLLTALRELLSDPRQREELGRRAREVVEEGRGAISRTIDILDSLLTTEAH